MAEPLHPALHTAFGLLWHSPDLPIPELPGAEDFASAAEAVEIIDETGCCWPELPPGPHDTPTLQMEPGDLRFRVDGTAEFRITGGQRIAWKRHDDCVKPEEISGLVLGSAMAAVLIQRGMLVLHGNALAHQGQAIVCLGHSGAGKSTLAYALMREGWQLLADDLVAVTADGLVLPGIPRIKLWHDAVEAYGLDAAALPRIHRQMRKYVIAGDGVQRAPQPIPLGALYLIEPHSAEEEGAGEITPVRSEKACASHLRAQVFQPRFVRGMGQEGLNFLATAHLQRLAPLATLPVPRGIDQLQSWLKGLDLLHAGASEQRTPRQ